MPTNKTIKTEAKQVNGFQIQVKARDFAMYIDQPEAMGGTNSGPNPLEYNLMSFAGCCVTIGHIIARQKHLTLRNFEAVVEGDLNTEVFMGKDGYERAGFQEVRINLLIDADLSQKEKEDFANEISARCPVAENLINSTPIKLCVQ